MRRWTPVLLGLLANSCLVIPTGDFKAFPESRRPISDSRVRAQWPGSTERADVLLSLGVPEATLEGERYFLYQWVTESTFFLAFWPAVGGGTLDVDFHDLLIEFDEEGYVVRAGELKTLLAEGLGRDQPLEMTEPIEIPILLDRPFGHDSGRLVLGQADLRLEFSGRQSGRYVIPPEGVLAFDYRARRERRSDLDWRSFDLKFRDPAGDVQEEGIQVDVQSLLTLARYLHQHSPEIQIHD